MCFKFLKRKRAVIYGCRQAKTVFNQVKLPRMVTAVHRPDLRDGHVAFVDNGEVVFGKKVKQAERPCSGQTPVKIA